MLHHGDVDRVASRETGRPEHDGPCALCILVGDGEDFVDHAEQGVAGRLDRIPAIDRDVAVQDFLEDLGVGHEALALGDQPLERSLRVGLVGVGRTDEVHRDVGVDEDHSGSSVE